MKQGNIIAIWVKWHFYEMTVFLLGIWKNYLAFGLSYFSIPLLATTLFYPWKHYAWSYPKGFSLSGYYGVFISNFFSRIMGAVLRLALIIFGIIAEICIFFIGAAAIIAWIVLPLLSITVLILMLAV